MEISKTTNLKCSIPGGKLPNANCDQNNQMENNQTYQSQMTNWGGGVNYQMQIVTKLPHGK